MRWLKIFGGLIALLCVVGIVIAPGIYFSIVIGDRWGDVASGVFISVYIAAVLATCAVILERYERYL